MAKILQTKTERVRYGQEEKYIEDFEKFGWNLKQKQLLNRFGNPLPLGEYVSEDDKREKCFYDLSLERVVDEKVSKELISLETEYHSIKLEDASFGGGRVVGAIWLSLFSLTCIILGVIWLRTPGMVLAIASLAAGIFIFGAPISLIFANGCGRVVRANKKNKEIEKQKEQIVEEAQKLLKQ